MEVNTVNTDPWLASKDAAVYIGYKPSTLRRSRVSGTLAGKGTPKFTKAGTAVRYKKSDLDSWLNNDGDGYTEEIKE